MPLLDHFHEPMSSQRSWESFHSRWADSIGDWLHQVLPARYFTEILIHLGRQVEADVAEFEETTSNEPIGNGAGGVALQTYAPPAATHSVPVVFPDNIEIQVRDSKRDARLVAVVELISPRNKDRTDSRTAFAAKCSAYFQRGVGVAIVDVVTNYRHNIHNEVIQLMNAEDECSMPAKVFLFANAYRPVHRKDKNLLDFWIEELTIGGSLPVLPLSLRGDGVVPLDLETAYNDACRRSRFQT